MTREKVRIGGASGSWGDSPMAIGQLLGTEVDYLVMDYLAEVTMSLLARARMKDPQGGFPADFIRYLTPYLPEIARRGIKIASNGGGVNPQACKRLIEASCRELGLNLRVAVVEGDDVMPLVELLRSENSVREWVSGEPLPVNLLTANAYLGALPIAAAFSQGADIVITGRCADSALALGILMHEFTWRADDYDRLAAGSLVGHLLECGPQVTGGLFTDWATVPDWHVIGYPIAECLPDGSFTVTKPPDTGGLVTPQTVAEQVLYEVGDPAAYILPDVVGDFSEVRLVQEGLHRVRVSGARGLPPTSHYKVSATWQDGFRAVAMISIVGMDAVRKAERTAQALVDRARLHFVRRGWADFTAIHTEVLGAEAAYGSQSNARNAREVVLRMVVDHRDAKALDVFALELGSVGLSFAQGTTGLIGGRPKATPVVRLFSFLIEKARLRTPTIQVGSTPVLDVEVHTGGMAPDQFAHQSGRAEDSSPDTVDGPLIDVPLLSVAHARSGDKGNSSNIAIFCRKPEYMSHMRSVLTAGRLASHFMEQVGGPVLRYEVPGLAAFNFLLLDALGGGGMASRRLDAQGKAYGQRALEMLVPVPVSWGIS
jgi:hypothetical protein